MSTSSSNSNLGWSQRIETMLQVKDATKKPVCIHKVPRILRDLKPEAYEPQLIGLGPYHHCCENLFRMEHIKLITSKKSQKRYSYNDDDEAVERQRLQHFVNCCLYDQEFIPNIHASYDRYLEADEKLLAWMMVIDSIFLLQFLLGIERQKESCLWDSTRTSYLVDQNQSAYHSILKDIMKLENQIPIFVLDKILQLSAYDIGGHDIANDDDDDDDPLRMMLLKTCKKLSPLPTNETHLSFGITEYAHLLELMYYLIVPKADTLSHRVEYPIDQEAKPMENKDEEKQQQNKWFPNDKSPFTLEMFGQLNMQFVQVFKNSKPVKVIIRITRIVIDVLPPISSSISLKLRAGINDPEKSGNSASSREGDFKGAPTVEEISIPSVSKLKSIGVQFCHTDGPITSIKFDKRSRKFHLPVITINDNTEVIIRNLVAYEAQALPCPSYLARYTELMNGIIDTPEDVKLLRENGIIVQYLKKDEDVAELWNGMSRSIRLSYVPSIDKAIEKVNKYYNNNKKVKFIKFTKKCMFCGWRILMLFLALVLMVLMAIQSFCDVYNCPRALSPVTDEPK